MKRKICTKWAKTYSLPFPSMPSSPSLLYLPPQHLPHLTDCVSVPPVRLLTQPGLAHFVQCYSPERRPHPRRTRRPATICWIHQDSVLVFLFLLAASWDSGCVSLKRKKRKGEKKKKEGKERRGEGRGEEGRAGQGRRKREAEGKVDWFFFFHPSGIIALRGVIHQVPGKGHVWESK